MKRFKKVVALILSFVMIVGLLPAPVRAEDTTSTLLDAAIFCSDVHGTPNDVTSVFGGIKTSGITYSTASFVGDTDYSPSEVTSVACAALGTETKCYYAYGSHDSNYSDIQDVTGLIYSGDNYYIYTISQTDMESADNASEKAADFTEKVAALDKSKPLFIISHMPLHERRNDNNGAANWYTAISSAAGSMDIIFLWAHNHTNEDSVDTNAYYVEKNGSETISIQGGSTVTPNFTYMNAGYINANGQNPARKGIATTVQIYKDKLVFQDYNSSGAYMGDYAHNVEVSRAFAADASGSTEPSGSESADADESTEPSESESADTNESTESSESESADADESTEPSESESADANESTESSESESADASGSTDSNGGIVTVPDPTTATVTDATTTENKTVYVLVSTPTAGKQYIIASSNSAGSAYALKENTTTGTSVTINAATDSITAPYIETSDTTVMWNAASGMTFQSVNGGYYLTQTKSGKSRLLSFSTSSGTSWTVDANVLSYKGQQNIYYVSGGDTWSLSSSSNVYFYEKQTVAVTTSANGTYSIAGNPDEVEKVVENGTTVTLGSTLTFVPESGTTTTTDTSTTATYTVVDGGDPNGIISGISGNTVTFTGNYGKALVKVSYTVTVNGTKYTVDNYIVVEAISPYYTVDITHNADGNAESTADYTPVTEIIAIKGDEEINKSYNLWVDVYLNGETKDEVDDSKLTWASNNTSIATVDSNGNVTFTGAEGTVQITVYYAYIDNEGKTVYATDVVTFSVKKSQYTVPADGTDDFPEYPNQGAIRFDKTATAVGNFSQTGIANVELSMTGVPYGTNVKTDVVIMVDMTASMSDDDVTAAKLAVKELIQTLVYDKENDVYDSDIQLFVYSFMSGSSDSAVTINTFLDGATISSSSELTTALAKIDEFEQSSQGGGTRYNVALAKVYSTLTRDGAADNQFVVFVTDGVPTAYAYPDSTSSTGYSTVTGNNSETASLASGWFDDDGEVTTSFKTEYYTQLFKNMDIQVYTVGANITSGSDGAYLINHMSSNYSADGKTSTGETKYSFTCTTSGGITDDVLEIFTSIGESIKEAATNVVVEDKIADEYTMIFSLPSGVDSEDTNGQEFYIQAVSYDLDENKNRVDSDNDGVADYTVIEKFVLNSDGTWTHYIGTTICGDTCEHVISSGSNVTSISGTYFTYTSDENNGEIITWKADKLDTTELALQYFVYLDNSAGVAAANQVDAGTYPTNEYATLTYTNFKGTECQQYFPVPSLTWNGAQVTYVFYLVNENGQPVNRAGKVIPFAEAIYVTDPVTYDVTWNEEAGSENMLAENLFAIANVPDVYELYDEDAYYEIRVYQTEGVDEDAVNYNYFIIDGAGSGLTSYETTKVFNTKAGTKYDDYGIYSAQSIGTTLNTTDANGDATTVTTTVEAKDIDYANTTVAFAVVWKPALVEDTVVIDYGLDVVPNVYTNDGLAAGVTGVMLSAPNGVEMNTGTYSTAIESASIKSTDGIWTASVENQTSVRFHMNEMGISEPVTFYYQAGVNYYTYATNDGNTTATLNSTNMYSSVTVIPATTIYYEDSFVDLTSYTKDDDGNYVEDENSQWSSVGTTVNATQDVDRPGVSQSMGTAYDANNLYGYDSAYTNMSTYSMGSASSITVTSANRGVANFSFYGTGFDIIGLTSNTTGTLIVQVYNSSNTLVKTLIVDTYYGYAYSTDEGWYAVDSNDPNALYQVPVMQLNDLDYGKYTVKLTAGYNSYYDHTGDGKYTLYLDAVRIYDPCGSSNETANAAYVKDGEGYPEYTELRNEVITADTFDNLNSDSVSGIVFIDGASSEGASTTASVSDYTACGPNNELYLTYGQAVAFDLNATANNGSVSSVQLAIKTVKDTGYIEIYGLDDTGNETACLSETISTATDMYYDITALNGKTVVIKNSGVKDDAIISLTNIKVTYTAAQSSETEDDSTVASYSLLSVSRSSASYAVMSLSMDEEEETEESTEAVEIETEETTEVEETEAEETTEVEETEAEETTEVEETETEETTEVEETETEESEESESDSNSGASNIFNTIINAIGSLLNKWFR